MQLLSKFLTAGWCVAWRRKETNDTVFSEKEPFYLIPNPRDAWVADPFLFEYNDEPYIFGELYNLDDGRGAIAYCRPLQKECRWVKVIEEPYHMSYPFIYENETGIFIFIMPETSKNKTIQLYKAIAFPDVWERQPPLRKDIDYVDVTPFLQDVSQKAIAYRVDACNIQNSELWIIDLKNPDNDYQVQVNDAELRRPGGAINEKSRIRVGQDSTYDYGDGLIFFQYDEFNQNRYCEQELKRVYPNQLRFTSKIKCTGLHTYNQSEHYECIDVRIKRLMFRKITNKIKSIKG